MNFALCQKQLECHQRTFDTSYVKITQYELSQKKSDLCKAGLYFSIQPDKIRKF